jgi:hypothetical protein
MKKRKYTEIHLTPSPRPPYKKSDSATEGKGGVNCVKAKGRESNPPPCSRHLGQVV